MASNKEIAYTRLQCSNCWEIVEFDLRAGELPERCNNCRMMVGWLPPMCREENQNKDCCYKSQENIWEAPISKKTLDFLNQVFPKEDKDNQRNGRNQSYAERKARRQRRREARREKETS